MSEQFNLKLRLRTIVKALLSRKLNRTINETLNFFYSELQNEYGATKELASSLREDIERPLRRFITDQTENANRYYEEASQLKEVHAKMVKVLWEAKEEYYNAAYKTENTKIELEMLRKDPEMESASKKKTKTLEREIGTCKRLEELYICKIEEVNNFTEDYIKKSREIYDKFQRLEYNFIEKTKDVLTQFVIYQTAYLTKIAKVEPVTMGSVTKDIEIFVLKNKKDKQIVEEFKIEPLSLVVGLKYTESLVVDSHVAARVMRRLEARTLRRFKGEVI